MSLHAINLHGKLGKMFNREYKLDVATPAEAFRVLMRFVPGFRQFLEASEKQGITFRVLVDGKIVDFHDRLLATFRSTIDIYPIVIGSKRAGVFQTIVGVVLIAAAVATAFVTAGTSLSAVGALSAAFTGGAGVTAQFLAFAGASMALGGIATMIANPKAPSFDSGGDNKRSYLFSGSAQTGRQGAALPIGYGTLHVGPIIVSAGINAERLSLADTTGTDTDGDGVLDDFNGDGFPDESRV